MTDKDIQAYYEKNKKQFTTPETRNLSVVLAKDEATAAKAKAAIAAGQSWASVAKKYSIDPAAKDNGGTLSNVTKGQGSPVFDKAVFGAKKGAIIGPGQDGRRLVRVPRRQVEAREGHAAERRHEGAAEEHGRADQAADGADEVRQGVHGPLEGQDGLPEGVRRRRLLEREGQAGVDRSARRGPADAAQTAPSNSATTTAPTTGG